MQYGFEENFIFLGVPCLRVLLTGSIFEGMCCLSFGEANLLLLLRRLGLCGAGHCHCWQPVVDKVDNQITVLLTMMGE